MSGSDDYWRDQRYEDTFFALHGHLSGRVDSECSLCGPQEVTP